MKGALDAIVMRIRKERKKERKESSIFFSIGPLGRGSVGITSISGSELESLTCRSGMAFGAVKSAAHEVHGCGNSVPFEEV